MADKQLQIKISATDSASAVFRKLGASAKQSATDMTTGAKQSAQALTQLGTEAGKTEKQIAASGKAQQAFGIASAAIGASIGLFSREIVTNNQNLNTLERTYGDATGAMRAFADQVQATTAFSSESAVQAENIFGTLVRNYGISIEQAQQLVAISTDLATTSGLGLEDVATRVQAAIRGEGEAAEALGLTMNQQAIDRNNLTLTMSNQEAAQFRLNALMEQTTFAQGAAGEKAATTAGQVAQLNNKFQDMARGAIEAAGPLPQIVSGLTNVGAQSGLAITGVASLVKGLSSLGTAAGNVSKLSSAFALLSNPIVLAGGAIAVMSAIAIKNIFEHGDSVEKLNEGYEALANTISHMPDMGATVTQTQQATDAAAQLARVNGELLERQVALNAEQEKRTGGVAFEFPGMEDGMARWSKSAQEVNNLLLETTLNVDEENKAVSLINETINTQGANLDAVMPRIQQLLSLYELWITSNGSMGISGDELIVQLQDLATHADTYGDAAAAAAAVNADFASSYVEVTNAIAGVVSSDASGAVAQAAADIKDLTANVIDSLQYFTATQDAFYGLSGGAEQFAAVQKEVFNVLEHGTEGQIRALGDLERAHANGQITADAFAAGLAVLSTQVDKTSADAALADAQHQRLAESMSATEIGARKAADGVSELSETTPRATGEIQHASAATDGLGEAASRTAGEIQHLIAASDGLGETASRTAGEIQHIAALQDGLTATAGRGSDEIHHLEQSHAQLGETFADVGGQATEYAKKLADVQKSMGAMSTGAGQVSVEFGVNTPALDVAVNLQVTKSSLDAVLGTIKTAQGLSSQLGDAESWADKLIGDRGVWSEMDQLLADQRINIDQYNAAQTAQESITRDVANAQQDLLAVQVNLAPTLAAAVNEQANYINSLQDMEATQQLAALGWMDNAEAAKAMSLAQLAASSTTDTMRASTQEMIQAAAAADPVLKAMLEDMGLLNATTGEVNFETNADPIKVAVDALTGAIKDLSGLIEQIFNVDTSTNAPDTRGKIEELHGSINAIPRDVLTIITAADNASGTIQSVGAQLRALDGASARTYLDNYQTTHVTTIYSSSGVGPTPAMTGTTITGYAAGGTIGAIPTYITGGSHAIVGERGPELVWLPNGSQVTNTEGSKAEIARMRKGGAGGGTINIYGPMTLNPASSDAYDALQQEMRGGARR